MSKDNSLMVLDNGLNGNPKDIQEALQTITDRHIEISNIKTPKAYQYKKQSFDYVKIEYMRGIANKYFPTHSWEIISTEVLGSEAYVVHGRLTWHEEANGVMVKRTGDMVAAHRIQKKRGTNEFVDIGNDVKSANTDCMKKALQMYMNIADDVYRNQVEDLTLTDEQKNDILVIASEISEERMEQIHGLINDQAINTANYNSSKIKLERELERKNEKSEQ